VVGVGQDITELKKTQSQVIQSSKLASLGEMATSVAHELNQPLNTIRMVASNIADKIEFNKVTKEYLCSKLLRIDEQVVRASKIINHMQMFGRKADENPINLDPWAALNSVMDLVGEQLRLESIEVTTNCDYEGPIIFGNQIQLEQVFVNIIGNARDAILESGAKTKRELTITGAPAADDEFTISFTDTGIGIPEKLLPRIFEPFITSKPMGKGTGLGLSVSYGIIREMNGTITAKNVETGAQFNITLPLVSTS
jgi:C4-dicarboxylate-specific signal transduction histidine kinase